MFTYRYDLNTATSTQYLSKGSSVPKLQGTHGSLRGKGVQKGWSPAWNLPVGSLAGDPDQGVMLTLPADSEVNLTPKMFPRNAP